MLPWAGELREADALLRPRLSREAIAAILEQVPDEWLLPEADFPTPAEKRSGYVEYLTHRVEAAPLFVEEAINARARLV
jgi:hypothetical protein